MIGIFCFGGFYYQIRPLKTLLKYLKCTLAAAAAAGAG